MTHPNASGWSEALVQLLNRSSTEEGADLAAPDGIFLRALRMLLAVLS